MSTRSAGEALALAALALVACSGAGDGADACRTIERARCESEALCDDWSERTRDQCIRDRDARCKAGGSDAVRAMSDEQIDQCEAAIRAANCEALAEPESIQGCEGLRSATDARADAGGDSR